MRRVGPLLVAAVCFFLAFGRPAGAHGGGGTEATNFETTIDGITPVLPGVGVRLVEVEHRLELRNDGPEVLVLGYEHEPYLRVGPDGTFENRESPTAGRNRQSEHGQDDGHDHQHEPSAANGAPASAPPAWRKVSNAPVTRWHDHRLHWMAAHDPPQVEARPGEHHVVIPRWEVTLRRGEAESVVYGTLTWRPGPSPAPWFGLMAAAFLGAGALGRLRRWGRPLAVVAAMVLAVDVVHAVSVALAGGGSLGAQLVKIATGNVYGIFGWVLAAIAIRFLRQGKVDGLYAGVFAGLSVAVFGGLLDLAVLSRSVTPFALPIGFARFCVAFTAGAGLGLAAACLLVIQRTPEARRVVGGADDDDPIRADDGRGRGRGNDQHGSPGPERPNRAGNGKPDVLGVGRRSGPPD